MSSSPDGIHLESTPRNKNALHLTYFLELDSLVNHSPVWPPPYLSPKSGISALTPVTIYFTLCFLL